MRAPALPLHETGAQPIIRADATARMGAEAPYLFSPPHTDKTMDEKDNK